MSESIPHQYHNRERRHASAIFHAALKAVSPEACLARALRRDGDRLHVGNLQVSIERFDRVLVIGAGKASAAMAAAVEAILGEKVTGGLVVTKYGHGMPLNRIQVHEAGHPIPDANGLRAAKGIVALLREADEGTLIFCLISGGGSALMPMPIKGITLADKQAVSRLMLASGAEIHEINIIRKHLSRIKGGGLAEAAGCARLVSLILSDVVGDDLASIASGPTVPDISTPADCAAILDQYSLWERLPASVADHFSPDRSIGSKNRHGGGAKAGPARVSNLIIGSNAQALVAASEKAAELGYAPLILTSVLKGEAREAGHVLSAIALEAARSGSPIAGPACLLSGGETTVNLVGKGRGGRNMELALTAARDLDGCEPAVLLSAGTDGTDGPTDAAGAYVTGASAAKARALGLSAEASLRANDSYTFFKRMGDLFQIGPTRTNVMDLQIILVAGTCRKPSEFEEGKGAVPSRELE